LPPWTKALLDIINSGRVFRALNKGDRVSSDSMRPQSVFETVKLYADKAGMSIAPHNLCRTSL